MAGLLGMMDDPQSQGLLSLGLRLMSTPGNFGSALGQAGLGAMGDMQQAMQLQQRNKLQEQAALMQKLQMDQMLEQARRQKEAEASAQAAAQRKGAYLDTLGGMQGPGMPFDPMSALSAGLDPQMIKFMAEAPNLGRAEVARVEDTADGKVQLDKYGKPVGPVLPRYVAPQLVDTGGSKQFVVPTAGASFPVTMDPAQRDASARGWAAQQLGRDRLAFDQTKPAAPKADMNIQRVTDAQEVLQILKVAEPLLNESTGSYAGVAVDEVARAFGRSTPGAEAAAQLKTLQGLLISKMPKMSGPQSDKDVQLYREMAGQIGDATLPIDTRKAAIKTIRQINEKYLGIQPAPMPSIDTNAGIPKVKFLGFE